MPRLHPPPPEEGSRRPDRAAGHVLCSGPFPGLTLTVRNTLYISADPGSAVTRVRGPLRGMFWYFLGDPVCFLQNAGRPPATFLRDPTLAPHQPGRGRRAPDRPARAEPRASQVPLRLPGPTPRTPRTPAGGSRARPGLEALEAGGDLF